MIPYQDMTFADWNFYWGESVLFAKLQGVWQGVVPSPYGENGEYEHSDSTRLDDIADNGGTIQFNYFGARGSIRVSPLLPFTSNDWITYEPTLGYFILGGKLALLTSHAPRNRIKGLHQRRLCPVLPLDASALPKSVASVISLETRFYELYQVIVTEIARRMNEPFPTSWHAAIDTAIQDSVSPAVILHSDVALVPVKGTDCGHLLFKGTLIGKVTKVGTKLRFTPRCKPATAIESSVNSWVLSKLVHKHDSLI